MTDQDRLGTHHSFGRDPAFEGAHAPVVSSDSQPDHRRIIEFCERIFDLVFLAFYVMIIARISFSVLHLPPPKGIATDLMNFISSFMHPLDPLAHPTKIMETGGQMLWTGVLLLGIIFFIQCIVSVIFGSLRSKYN